MHWYNWYTSQKYCLSIDQDICCLTVSWTITDAVDFQYAVVLEVGDDSIISTWGMLFPLSLKYWIISLILLLLLMTLNVWLCYIWCVFHYWAWLGLFWLEHCLINSNFQFLIIIFLGVDMKNPNACLRSR